MEATLSFGLMLTKTVDELQAVAMSLGKILADTALALWDIKVHKGKVAEKNDRNACDTDHGGDAA